MYFYTPHFNEFMKEAVLNIREKKVLIVDDNESLLMALEYSIQQAGYTVLKAVDGEIAFKIANAEYPDIIVSDITMPEMDGIELCKKIRSVPSLSETPFILLTALGEPDERVKGLRSGADDYIVKPFDIEELIARIDIMYKNIQKRQFSNTLSGNLKELAIIDMLQILAQAHKEGVLRINAGDQSGIISICDGKIMDASFMDFTGEDALVELFTLTEGHFNYVPQEVASGAMSKPVNYIIFEVIRLIDERCELKDYIPGFTDKLVLNISVPNTEDTDGLVLAVKNGAATGQEIQSAVGLSLIRAEIGIARLLRDGMLKLAQNDKSIEITPVLNSKPMRILLAFVDAPSAKLFLEKTASAFNVPNTRGIKSGVADFLKITVSNVNLQIFSLRGEKKFSFLWEPMLHSSHAVIFVTCSAEDLEHIEFFKNKLSETKKIPFSLVSSDDKLILDEVELLNTTDKVSTFYNNLIKNHCF